MDKNQKPKNVLSRLIPLSAIYIFLLIVNIIYYTMISSFNSLNGFLLDLAITQLIYSLTFFYPAYLLILISIKKIERTNWNFMRYGFIAVIGGILSFLMAGFFYFCGNMDFIDFFHPFITYLSPLLVLIGIVYVIIGIIRSILEKKKTKK
jgi:hypothetical protein